MITVQPPRLSQKFTDEGEAFPLVDEMQRQLDQYGNDGRDGDVMVVESERLQYAVVSGLESRLVAETRDGRGVVRPPKRILHLFWDIVCGKKAQYLTVWYTVCMFISAPDPFHLG